MISFHHTKRLIDRGCEVFLTSIIATTEQLGPELADIFVVREFADIFPDEVPRIPPVKEVEFIIDLVPSIAPTYRAPNRMAPLELLEQKS